MSYKIISIFLLLSITTIIFAQNCLPNENNCKKCDKFGKICLECTEDVYIPDENGGCKPSEKCIVGKNYCNECSPAGNKCSVCELGYYPDENGGCSNTDNCEVSLKGECLECKKDFMLLGSKKFCKYIYSDNLYNCEYINEETGDCDSCIEGYFLNQGDKKCSSTDYCYESIFGVCQLCTVHYYLDKRENLCLERNFTSLNNCKVSLDGETCDECLDNYYFSEKENICVETKLCYELTVNLTCAKCSNNYFYIEKDSACVKDKNCLNGDKDLAICTLCNENYYLDIRDYSCKSNIENDKFNNCKFADEECFECLENFYLGDDLKCSKTNNCFISKNGKCLQCSENYYLDLDNRCTITRNCIHSDENSVCNECKNGYYFNKTIEYCEIVTEGFENCKSTDILGEKCEICKSGYYLFPLDNLCYNNSEKNRFNKCAKTDVNLTICYYCQDGYYLGSEDNLCSKVEGCSIIENEERCKKCDDYYCLDLKTGNCIDNDYEPINENNFIYFNCNKTNEEGTECAVCLNENMIIKNGLCYNIEDCEEIDGDNCLKCKSLEDRVFSDFCLNKDYGCVSSYALDCHICDNNFDFDDCNKCKEGFEFDENNNCVEIEKEEE